MPARLSGILMAALACLVCQRVSAVQVTWFSPGGSTVNLNGAGFPMTGDFVFEVGAFVGTFEPTPENMGDWAANWRRFGNERVRYNPVDRLFSGQFTVTSGNSVAPFLAGKEVYVWGFRAGLSSSEWILFRDPDWLWPVPGDPIYPFGIDWNAADMDVTAVVGEVDPDGSPFLMQSATVENVASPATTWVEWRDFELAGESLNGPDDDPDHDGVPNLMEFVFGLAPKVAGPPPQTPVALVDGHLQITIPRRVDHEATLVVEVSSDLKNWSSGTNETEMVSTGVAALVVRDKTAFAPPVGSRFMRVRASLP